MAVERLLDQLEQAESLDGVAGSIGAFWSAALKPAWLRDVLSGRQLGHPLHPAAVLLPAGALLSASVLDVLAPRADGDGGRASRRLIAWGLVTAVPAALAGWSDWLDTEQAERRVGVVHAASNATGLTAYALSLWQRSRGGGGRASGFAGALALGLGGWLGGHLAYAQGVGVDTTAFQSGPTEWTDVAGSGEVTASLHRIEVRGVGLLLSRVDGEVTALSDRCTHRGASLSEGDRSGDCVVCPWHGSMFALSTGAVRRGPATRPQPRFECRESDGRIEVRRHEARALRTNPA